eukprot:scaffold17820_cov42-Cyclotella_meneghiniana.AAC.1
MGAEVVPFHFAAEWPSSINALQVDLQQATAFAVSKACDTLLVVRTAVPVDDAVVVRGAARLVSAMAVARHGCLRNFGARGLLGNGREL